MKRLTDREFDVAVVGAGSAGAAAAYQLARRGLSVLCVEGRALDRAGAQWVNGVPGGAFDRADVPRPEGLERLAEGVPFHLVAGEGPSKVVIEEHGLIEVDMRKLVGRLQAMAARVGAEFMERARVLDFDGVRLATALGEVRADIFVDASGLNGARLLGQPAYSRGDVCAAAQQVHAVVDQDGAQEFCARYGASPGHTICLTGIAGGYSILNVRVDRDHVSILTGSIPAGGYPSGRRLLEAFVEEQPWIGERRFGGARGIPLGPVSPALARGNTAAIGDACGQVFAAHGSGVGAGMIAARYVAEALAAGEGLQAYARRWRRDFGGVFAAYDRFRRFSETLDVEDLAGLMSSGLFDEAMGRAGLEQTIPGLEVSALWAKLGAAGRAPRLAARLAPVVLGMLVDLWMGQRAGDGSA